MSRALRAALPFFAVVFAAGFVMGTLRVLVLAPLLGAVGAVLAELPVMLGVAFLAARWAVGRHGVAPEAGARLAMGALALTLLMAAEVALGLWGFGRSLPEIAAGFARPEGLLGLAGQALFGLMPALLLLRPEAPR